MPINDFQILDTTLREGEQGFGVFFPIKAKMDIARTLDDLHIDFIEVGHPAVAPSIEKAVKKIRSLDLKANLIAHSLVSVEEVELVASLGIPWVGLFCGINDFSIKKYHLNKTEVFKKVEVVMRRSKELGLKIRFTCEDASRTKIDELEEFYNFLFDLGVDRIGFADTTGILNPEETETVLKRLKQSIEVERLHFHAHNDRGFALENSIIAHKYGVKCVDVSILGLGERVGITNLEDFLIYLQNKGCSKYKFPKIGTLNSLVSKYIKWERYSNRRFAHKGGIHIAGVLENPETYEFIQPEKLGKDRIIVLSKLSGQSAVQYMLEKSGVEANNDIIQKVTFCLKNEDKMELWKTDDFKIYLQKIGIV